MSESLDKKLPESKGAISKAQQQVIEALRVPGAHLVSPCDSPGHRTGYVTTGGLQGWICPVKLSTFKILKSKAIISQKSEGDYYRLSENKN